MCMKSSYCCLMLPTYGFHSLKSPPYLLQHFNEISWIGYVLHVEPAPVNNLKDFDEILKKWQNHMYLNMKEYDYCSMHPKGNNSIKGFTSKQVTTSWV